MTELPFTTLTDGRGRVTLCYEDDVPTQTGAIRQPFRMQTDVRPSKQILRLLEMYRNLEAAYGIAKGEIADLQGRLVAAEAEVAKLRKRGK